jgi:hypothetical protein
VAEEQALGAEALASFGLQALVREAVGPEPDRVDRHGQVDRLGLVGPALAHPAGLPVGERGQNCARVAQTVAVIEVVDGDLAVEQDGLLHAFQAE